MDEKQVAAEIDKFHSQYASMIQYNDENSLSSIITIAYLGAMQDWEIWEELILLGADHTFRLYLSTFPV